MPAAVPLEHFGICMEFALTYLKYYKYIAQMLFFCGLLYNQSIITQVLLIVDKEFVASDD